MERCTDARFDVRTRDIADLWMSLIHGREKSPPPHGEISSMSPRAGQVLTDDALVAIVTTSCGGVVGP